MQQSTSPSVVCAHCGRAFTWKPALAGRKGKCSCGEIVIFPETPPAAPPPPPPEDDFDALYALAEPEPEVAVNAPPVGVAPAPVTAAASLAYATPARKERFSYDALTSNPRDIYIPTGLLIAGFIGILVWAATKYDLPPAMLAIVSLITGVTTAVKTFIIIGLAIVFAPALGVSFGLLRTAILKFAAILVFTDAALLWLEVIMQETGAIPSSGRYYVRGTATVNLLLATAIIGFLIHYLFDMDRDEMGKIAIAMAVLSRLIGFGMKVLVVVLLSIMLAPSPANTPAAAATTTPTTPAVGQANSSASAPAPRAIRITETPADREIAQRLAKSPFIRPGSEARASMNAPRGLRELIDRAQAAGALKFHVDLQGSKTLSPVKAYIELPTDAEARARCFSEVDAVCQSYGHQLDTSVDANQRYLTVSFSQRRR